MNQRQANQTSKKTYKGQNIKLILKVYPLSAFGS
jgi:hypothetical protein